MPAASCVKCRLANIHGPLSCADCELEKRYAPGCIDMPLPIEVTEEGRCAIASDAIPFEVTLAGYECLNTL